MDKLKTIPLSKIKDTDPKREHGNIKELEGSIKKEGLLQPLVINQNNELICGRRRYLAIRMLGWPEVQVNQIKTKDDVDKLLKTLAENIMRKDLEWPEEVKAKAEIDQLMREKYGSAKPGERTDLTSSDSEQVWTTQKTAELLNQSKGLISEDLQLARDLEEDPELEKITTKSGAKMKIKKIREKEKVKKLKTPKGLFDVIVADPPWETGIWSATGRRGATKYLDMNLAEIEKINIPANENCVLWLWVINRYLHEAFHILESWGFDYKNCFTWAKDKFGLGDWGRGQTEHCLLAVKGKTVVDFTNTANIIYGIRREHSRKPEEFYKIVESTCNGKRLDYFARNKRDGWYCYGAEV